MYDFLLEQLIGKWSKFINSFSPDEVDMEAAKKVQILFENQYFTLGAVMFVLAIAAWFNPLSFSQTTKENYKRMWERNYKELFGRRAELYNVTESEAPYYYYRNCGILEDNNSVLTVDIGGGSTDFMIFKNEVPVKGTSVNFACNDLWRNGYNAFSNVKENGIYKSIQKKITENFKSTNLNGLNKQYLTNEKYSSAEIINFWFANENASKISDQLSNGVYKKIFLFHLSALMYHVCH